MAELKSALLFGVTIHFKMKMGPKESWFNLVQQKLKQPQNNNNNNKTTFLGRDSIEITIVSYIFPIPFLGPVSHFGSPWLP